MLLSRLLSVVLTLAWGLWFGGIVMVFLAVTSLFATFAGDRALAGTAAAGVFQRFEKYQLVLASVATVSALALRVGSRHAAGRKTAAVLLLALAAAIGVASTYAVSSRIRDLRLKGLSHTPEFRRLHGTSMALYSSQALALLAAGLVLPGAITHARGDSPAA